MAKSDIPETILGTQSPPNRFCVVMASKNPTCGAIDVQYFYHDDIHAPTPTPWHQILDPPLARRYQGRYFF